MAPAPRCRAAAWRWRRQRQAAAMGNAPGSVSTVNRCAECCCAGVPSCMESHADRNIELANHLDLGSNHLRTEPVFKRQWPEGTQGSLREETQETTDSSAALVADLGVEKEDTALEAYEAMMVELNVDIRKGLAATPWTRPRTPRLVVMVPVTAPAMQRATAPPPSPRQAAPEPADEPAPLCDLGPAQEEAAGRPGRAEIEALRSMELDEGSPSSPGWQSPPRVSMPHGPSSPLKPPSRASSWSLASEQMEMANRLQVLDAEVPEDNPDPSPTTRPSRHAGPRMGSDVHGDDFSGFEEAGTLDDMEEPKDIATRATWRRRMSPEEVDAAESESCVSSVPDRPPVIRLSPAQPAVVAAPSLHAKDLPSEPETSELGSPL